jgi:hypothetical protein
VFRGINLNFCKVIPDEDEEFDRRPYYSPFEEFSEEDISSNAIVFGYYKGIFFDMSFSSPEPYNTFIAYLREHSEEGALSAKKLDHLSD